MAVIEQADWEIIGFIVTGYIGCIIIGICFVHSYQNMSKMELKMRYATMISLGTAFMFCFFVGFLRTTIVFNIPFQYRSVSCNILYGICYVFYVVSKFAMYMLFTFRIQAVLGETAFSVSQGFLRCMRVIMCTLGVACCVLVFLAPKQEVITPQFDISLCTVAPSLAHLDIGSIGIMGFILVDLLLNIWLLFLYVSKLYKFTKLFLDPGDAADKRRVKQTRKIESQLIKTTILVSMSISSTLFFILIGNFVSWAVGWFIPCDMIVNSIAIYLMYAYSHPMYLWCCKLCIGCCELFIVTDDKSVFTSHGSNHHHHRESIQSTTLTTPEAKVLGRH